MKRTDLILSDMAWIDIVQPELEAMENLSEETGIPLRALENCLDPEHLPKYENLGRSAFIILRVIDPSADALADTVEELTTKIALFVTPTRVVTVHRLDQSFIRDLREQVHMSPGCCDYKTLVKHLLESSILSYDKPLTELEHKVDVFEEKIFKSKATGEVLEECYYLKRNASACRKVLKFTIDVMNRLIARPEFESSDFQELREFNDRLLFYTDDVLENVTGLLNIHIALSSQKTNEASYRTNEIVRILTIFSIFFLPLNFIAGIYGMNFEHIPELKWEYGYYLALGVMGTVFIGIFGWMYHKGWLHRS